MAEILVEFVPDFTKLESGVDQLVSSNTISKEMAALFTDAGKSLDQFGAKFAKLGGGNTLKPAIDEAKKSINSLSTSGIKDLGELKKRVDGITKSFIDGFGEGVETALKDAGVSVKQFDDILKKNLATDKTLKQELREMNEALAQMKLRGHDNTQQYQELAKKAGEYRDTIQDVNEEINRQASDTGKLDVAIRFVQGLASAYSVLQGIQGLVGKDNEELQKTLLKVNSAMAILNGLQSIQNELKRKDNILTIAQNNLQKLYAIAVGNSTGATKAFRIALASTGIGLLIIGIGLLITNLDKLKNAFSPAVSEAEKLEEITRKQYDASLLAVEGFDLEERRLKALGVAEDEIREKKRQRIVLTLKAADAELKALDAVLSATIESSAKGAAAAAGNPLLGLFFKDLDDVKKVQDTVTEISNKRKELEVEILELNKADVDEKKKTSKESADAAIAAREKLNAKLAQLREEERQQILAGIRRQLLDVKNGSEEELVLLKQLAIKKGLFEIETEKLVGERKKEALRSIQLEVEQLDKDFNNKNKNRRIENEIAIINASLDQQSLAVEEREQLTIELLERQRTLELNAVINNKTKEKEINAKFDKEIVEQRKAIRDAAFADEIQTIERNAFIAKTIAEQNAADETLPIQKRKEALEDLEDFERAIIGRRRSENEKQLSDGVKSLEDFQKTSQEIDNDAFVSKSKFEKAQTDLVKTESEKRLNHLKEVVGAVAEFAGQAIDSLRGFMETIAQNEDNRIAAQKDSLERLRQNGIVSQKEYEARLKVIDRLDRQNKQRQAEREKAMALFQALVNGAAAIVEAAPDPFKIVATSVLVAAQIAAIAARQVPKFGKGTKSAPKGFAEVGETGTELIQMNGKYFVADHPQVIWMKGGERVYNPEETKDILTPQANMTVINNTNGHSKDLQIDYDKMAKKFGDEIAKHPRLINNIDADGYSQYIIEGLNKSKYLNNRFRF